MDKIWWQKLLCEFHVVRKHKAVESSRGPENDEMQGMRMWEYLSRGECEWNII